MLGWLRSLFTSPRPDRSVPGPPPHGFVPPASFTFELDDYCQQEALSATNVAFFAAEAATIEALHAGQDTSMGFERIHQIQTPPVPLAELRIPLTELRAALAGTGARRYPRVLMWVGSSREPRPGVEAFGGDTFAVLLEPTPNQQYAQRIWLHMQVLPEKAVPLMCELLLVLGRRYGLVLADWTALRLVDLRDAAAIERYLAE